MVPLKYYQEKEVYYETGINDLLEFLPEQW